METRKRILVVEDAEDLATVLRDRFRSEGYSVDTVHDGESALRSAEQTRCDLILLDVMLPDMSGFDVCRTIRQRDHSTPVLMLTARSETVDKIVGLRLGADDYVTEPFDMSELVARVEALLRRTSHISKVSAGRFRFGAIEVDLPGAEVRRDGIRVDLTAREFLLLRHLIENRGVVQSRDALLKSVWDYDAGLSTRTLDVHIAWLRQKLEEEPSRRGITFLTEIARWLVFVPAREVNGFQRADLIDASVIWTLMFEVVFYLLLPVIFFVFKGYRIFIYIALAGAASWTLAQHGAAAFTPALVRGSLFRFTAFALNSVFGFGFGLGMLVAYLYARTPKRGWQVLQRRWLTPIPLFFLAAPVLFNVGSYSPAEFFLLGGAFVFVVAGNDFFGLLSSKAVFLLGTVSYSFYITHGTVLFSVTHLFDRWVQIRTLSPLEYWSLIGVAGVSAVCLSTLLYWTVERRFMRRSSAWLPAAAPDLVAPVALEARTVSAGLGTPTP